MDNKKIINANLKAFMAMLEGLSDEERKNILLPLMHKGNITEEQVMIVLNHMLKGSE